MTHEEMGRALGDGWVWDQGYEEWTFDADWHEVVCRERGEIGEVEWRGSTTICVTPEAAVAVAHLLVAAEKVAGGAPLYSRRPLSPHPIVAIRRLTETLADEAESAPTARRAQ